MKLSVGETAKLMGISVRTLRYYDDIGLLTPAEISDAGYRYYDGENLAALQEILFYRELEFPLSEIARILTEPEHDRTEALARHRELLILRRRHIDDLLKLVDDTMGGENEMTSDKFTFADVKEAKEKYAAEAKARWGLTVSYRESTRRQAQRTEAESADMMAEMNGIFSAFAKSMDKDPSDLEVQALVRRWQALITRYHYDCTDEILDGLADMYTADERFTESLDRFGDGTAQFMHDAIKAYCGKGKAF